jgi:hypothetical protein
MDRHATHLDILPQMLAALGQHNAQRRRGDLGVLEEQLVEIAHAIEQQIARVDRLDLEELRHHRRQHRRGLTDGRGFERRLIHGFRAVVERSGELRAVVEQIQPVAARFPWLITLHAMIGSPYEQKRKNEEKS